MKWFKDLDHDLIVENFRNGYDFSKSEDKGYVYLIACGDYHKIGKAKNLLKRFSAYKTHNPYEVLLIKHVVVDDYGLFENRLHTLFGSFNHHGEWYRFTDGSLEVVKRIFDSYAV